MTDLATFQLKGSLADLDGHIRVNDRLLEINNMNVKEATKSDALKIISDSSSHISFLLSREIQPNMTFGSLLSKIKSGRNLDPGCLQPTIWQEFTLKVSKVAIFFRWQSKQNEIIDQVLLL